MLNSECVVADIMKHACYAAHIMSNMGFVMCGSICILRESSPCKTALVTGDAVKQQNEAASLLLVGFKMMNGFCLLTSDETESLRRLKVPILLLTFENKKINALNSNKYTLMCQCSYFQS